MTTQEHVAAGPRASGLVTDDVFRWAEQTPDAPAMAFEGTEYTWAQWGERIRRVCGALLDHGIAPGERVAFLGKNHPACLELTLAASHVGAANAVINWRLAGDELVYVLTDSAPRLLVVTDDLLPAWQAVQERLPGIERVLVVGEGGDDGDYEEWLASGSPDPVDSPARPGDTALILYTSGTTGFPKGAMLTHRGLNAHTTALAPHFPMKSGDRTLVAMPLFHVGGTCYALVGFRLGVPSTVLREVTGPGIIGSVLAGCNHAFLVPAVLAGLVQAGEQAMTPMARMKVVAYGASPAPLPVLRACLAAWPDTDFLQVYGLTEVSGVVTTLSPEAHRDDAHPERLASAGRPLEGVEMRLVDPLTLEDAAPGEPGELWFRTEQRMAGYLDRPEATAEMITEDGWLRSGDVGRLDDGGFVFIEDRIKDMIITGGENVYSPEVERVVQEYPGVAEVAVIGIPHETFGEAVHAVVAPAPGETVDVEALTAFCREHLAGYKCPRSIEVVDALPRNPSGKILKPQLRRPYWEGHERRI